MNEVGNGKSLTGRFTEVLRDALQPIGFARFGRSNLWYGRLGEVVLIAFVVRSRWDESAQFVAGVWHPERSRQVSLKGSMRLQMEAAFGDVGPAGIGAQHWWRLEAPGERDGAIECLRGPACTWMSAFADPRHLESLLGPAADVAADDGWASGILADAPELDARAFAPARAWTDGEQRRLVRETLQPVLAAEGFEWTESERQAAFVRRRGELWDAIEGRLHSNGVHTAFNWFVTTPRFWSVRSSLKGLLVQSNGGELGLHGERDPVRCFGNDSIATPGGALVLASAVRAQALPRFGDIASREDFLSAISFGWESMASPLARAWKK